jgi:hypothetical protein
VAGLAALAVVCAAACQSRQPTEEEKAAQASQAAPAPAGHTSDASGQAATPGSGGAPSASRPSAPASDAPSAGDTPRGAGLDAPLAAAPAPREYTLPAGTRIPVRTTTTLSTEHAVDGAAFSGVLERDLEVDGTVLAKEGANVNGVVVSSDPGGRVKGVASLAINITSIAGSDGEPIRVTTRAHTAVAPKSTGRDVKRGGIMTGAGAAIGAIAGGGKGAAVGAGVGAAAGVGTAMATRGKPAVIPAETLVQFTLRAPVTVVRLP